MIMAPSLLVVYSHTIDEERTLQSKGLTHNWAELVIMECGH